MLAIDNAMNLGILEFSILLFADILFLIGAEESNNIIFPFFNVKYSIVDISISEKFFGLIVSI